MNDKGRPHPGCGFETDSAPVLRHDHRVGDSQALASAFTHRLCGKKRIKNLRLDGLRYSRPGIADPNLNAFLVQASTDSDGSLSAGAFEHIGNRVRGVHDQVE